MMKKLTHLILGLGLKFNLSQTKKITLFEKLKSFFEITKYMIRYAI